MAREQRPNIFTLEFWQYTATNAVYAFASGALGPLVANQANMIHSVPWYAALSSGAIGMVIVVLGSLASNQIPDRLPGSFLKESDEEERIERMILREERLAQARKELREKGEETLVNEKHRAPESERSTPTDDYNITGLPPKVVRPEQSQVSYRVHEPEPQPPQPTPRAYSEEPPPKHVGSQQDSMEDWPQGGKRGKQSRRGNR